MYDNTMLISLYVERYALKIKLNEYSKAQRDTSVVEGQLAKTGVQL